MKCPSGGSGEGVIYPPLMTYREMFDYWSYSYIYSALFLMPFHINSPLIWSATTLRGREMLSI